MATYNFLDKTGLGQVWAKIKALIVQSDWEEDDSTDSAYIQNKPAIHAGEGENSIVEGQIGETDFSKSYTIYITGAAKATTYSYTTEEESLPSGSLSSYIAYYASGTSAMYQYARINSIDTTNNTITFSRTFSVSSALSNVEVLILKDIQIANGTYSHAEGRGNVAGGTYSHAEGYLTVAINGYAHAEGAFTTASGTASHAEGAYTTASNTYSHSEGTYTKASGNRSHAEGYYTTASNVNTHAEGISTTASGDTSHAEGVGGTASGFSTHVEGGYAALSVTLAGAANVLTYGVETTSIFNGNSTVLIGGKVVSSNTWSPTAPEITSVTVSGDILTSITLDKTLNADTAVSGSYYLLVPNKASGQGAHAEGGASLSSGNYSHAEGGRTRSSGTWSHSEGYNTIASGTASHAGGYAGTASGNYSHAEGYHSTASGIASHAEGGGTIAQRESQHVFGEYNIADNGGTGETTERGEYVEIVGNGTADNARSNAYTLDWSGNGWFAGKVSAGTIANPASVVNANDLATKAYVDAQAGGTQSNWDENDSTDPSYVQNRTHYKETTYTPGLDLSDIKNSEIIDQSESPVEYGDYTYSYFRPFHYPINLTEMYPGYFPGTTSIVDVVNLSSDAAYVEINGVSYPLEIAYESTPTPSIVCYNEEILIYVEDDDFDDYYRYPINLIFTKEDTAINSLILHLPLFNSVEEYHTLDPRYIPKDATVMVVTVIEEYVGNEPVYSADKTCEEIYNHVSNGGIAVCNYDGSLFPLLTCIGCESYDGWYNILFYAAESYHYTDDVTGTQFTSFSSFVVHMERDTEYDDNDVISFTYTDDILPQQGFMNPLPDGTASAGSSYFYSPADHVHPKITQALSISSNVITLTGSDGTTSSVTLPVYNGGVVVSA